MKHLYFLIILFIGYTGYGQEVTYPNFKGRLLNETTNFGNYKIIAQTKGDFNNDGLDDVALVVQCVDSVLLKRCHTCYPVKNTPRLLLVAVNTPTGAKIVYQNNTFVLLGDEGGMETDFQPQLSIERQQFLLMYQFTRGNLTYTFDYALENLYVAQVQSNGVTGGTGEYEFDRYDFKSGTVVCKTGFIDGETEIEKTFSFTLPIPTLSEYQSYYREEKEMVPGHSLF